MKKQLLQWVSEVIFLTFRFRFPALLKCLHFRLSAFVSWKLWWQHRKQLRIGPRASTFACYGTVLKVSQIPVKLLKIARQQTGRREKSHTYTSGEKDWWGQSARAWLVILWYVLRRFSFRPFGGSVTTWKGTYDSKELRPTTTLERWK